MLSHTMPADRDDKSEPFQTALQSHLLQTTPTSCERSCPEVRWSEAGVAKSVSLSARKTLGSAPGVDVPIADPLVSRLHAEFDPHEDGVWVRDLGSRNGTYVEGVRVRDARVPEGGRVRLGATTLTVHYDGAPTRIDIWPDERFGPLIGRSVAMRELFAMIACVAALDGTVLIQGETGTGKELVARALHEASTRADGPLVVVDCGALPETLLEAELFGHAKGAFTGATTARAGAIESAIGGTVFLDEIGELPLAMQPKLLRVLESRTVRRLGESAHRAVDVRFVTATHRDLRTMVNAGAFREDLYFRLAVLPLSVPPLRERAEDIPLLVEHFLPRGVRTALDPSFDRDVASQPWLGNVRELRNFVERARAFGTRRALEMLPKSSEPPPPPSPSARDTLPEPSIDESFKDVRERWIEHLERSYVRALLARHGGNVSAASEAAGLTRAYLHRLIRKHST